jgi:hypothetical protein
VILRGNALFLSSFAQKADKTYRQLLKVRSFAAGAQIRLEFFALQRKLNSWRFGVAALMGVSSLRPQAALYSAAFFFAFAATAAG